MDQYIHWHTMVMSSISGQLLEIIFDFYLCPRHKTIVDKYNKPSVHKAHNIPQQLT